MFKESAIISNLKVDGITLDAIIQDNKIRYYYDKLKFTRHTLLSYYNGISSYPLVKNWIVSIERDYKINKILNG